MVSTCTFRHVKVGTIVLIRWDGFTALGSDENVKWFVEELSKMFELKLKGIIGPGDNDQKQMRVLSRVITWDSRGITYEADQRHAEIIIKTLGLESSKQVATPGDRDDGYKEGDDELLTGSDVTRYRGIVARGNYLSQDRMDIQYAVKELSRKMSSPTVADERRMKRVVDI